jgi:hypothetical protein|uniref:Uncharacterized protein n=1 Tax=Myoviridae sp. ctKHS5 TaxID=2823541 RepID=A0A8S5L8B9_9CAUD|nr:MAG TPA: hypothetical protein [Myoviridae sp. ctKHS5]
MNVREQILEIDIKSYLPLLFKKMTRTILIKCLKKTTIKLFFVNKPIVRHSGRGVFSLPFHLMA